MSGLPQPVYYIDHCHGGNGVIDLACAKWPAWVNWREFALQGMMMHYWAYPEGVDCAWLAKDGDGALGVFISAGCGPIPAASLVMDQLPPQEVEVLLHGLPELGGARPLHALALPEDFSALARRGFYVYDWTDVHRSYADAKHAYEAVMQPEQALAQSSLPETLQQLAQAVTLDTLRFAETPLLDITAWVHCWVDA